MSNNKAYEVRTWQRNAYRAASPLRTTVAAAFDDFAAYMRSNPDAKVRLVNVTTRKVLRTNESYKQRKINA